VNEIHFKTCTSAYNCLRDMARQVEAALGNPGNWRIVFEDGLRGFAARISTLTASLQLLDKPFEVPAAGLSPEQWAIDTDQRIAEILFGMDSGLERRIKPIRVRVWEVFSASGRILASAL
jgi:hypothetical protein